MVFIPFHGVTVALLEWLFPGGTNLFSYSYALVLVDYFVQSFCTRAADSRCLLCNSHFTQSGVGQKSWDVEIFMVLETEKICNVRIESDIKNKNKYEIAQTDRKNARLKEALLLPICYIAKHFGEIFSPEPLCSSPGFCSLQALFQKYAPPKPYLENMYGMPWLRLVPK